MDTLKRTAHELEELRLALIARDNAEHFEPVLQGQDAGDWEFEQASRRASELIRELDCQLTADGWAPTAEMGVREAGESWVYGSVLRRAPLREITRGFLEPVRRISLVAAVPEKVALYLIIMLPDGRDGLDRDLHGGIGYHYHYLNGKRQRSNVILSFDTRWTPAANVEESTNEDSWPLFVETHAEGKAHFKAKPWNWCDEKRKSMHDVCKPDLHRGIDQFRCAADGAEAVWPRLAVLTPHTSKVVTAPPLTLLKTGRGKSRKGR